MRQPLAVILRPLGLGDFLTGVPAYRAIARALSDHRIVLAAPAPLAALIDLTGAVAELHPTQALAPLAAALYDADVAIDLHGRGPASQRILLAAGSRRLIAFANAAVPETAGGPTWRADEHEVARWCRMLAHSGIGADPGELDLAQPADVKVPADLHGVTLIHASAASESRRWPIERWTAVARAERAAGRKVIFTGDTRDVQRVNAIADAAGIARTSVFAGRTTLRGLAGLVAAAGRVVCGDTGVGHLATAYRTPSVVLFGPISPAQWGPPPERTYHRVFWAGRLGDPHGTQIDPGLLEISSDAVIAALGELALNNVAVWTEPDPFGGC